MTTTGAWAKILSDPQFKVLEGRTKEELKGKYKVGITPEKSAASPRSPKARTPTATRATRATPAKTKSPTATTTPASKKTPAKRTPAKAKTPAKSPASPPARRTPGRSTRTATTPKVRQRSQLPRDPGVTRGTPKNIYKYIYIYTPGKTKRWNQSSVEPTHLNHDEP